MVKEVHCQLEKFAKYSLNKYRSIEGLVKCTNLQSQLKQLKQFKQLKQLKQFTTNKLQYSLISSYNSTDRTSQPKVGG